MGGWLLSAEVWQACDREPLKYPWCKLLVRTWNSGHSSLQCTWSLSSSDAQIHFLQGVRHGLQYIQEIIAKLLWLRSKDGLQMPAHPPSISDGNEDPTKETRRLGGHIFRWSHRDTMLKVMCILIQMLFLFCLYFKPILSSILKLWCQSIQVNSFGQLMSLKRKPTSEHHNTTLPEMRTVRRATLLEKGAGVPHGFFF